MPLHTADDGPVAATGAASEREPQQLTLANGLRVVFESQPWLETLSLTLLVPFGSATDPEGADGSANVLHNWLQRGVGGLGSRELSDALDDLGVIRGGSSGREASTLSAAFLAVDAERALPLVAAMATDPALDDGEFAGARELALEEVRALQDSPTERLMEALHARYFTSAHRRSPVGTLESVMALTAESVRQDAAVRLGPQGAVLALAGGGEFERLVPAVTAAFGTWRGATMPVPEPEVAPAQVHHVDAESSQVHIGLAFAGSPPGSEEGYRNSLALAVLSGSAGARLHTEVREKRGLVYSVYATSRTLRRFGYTVGYAGTTPERAVETLEVYLQELARLRLGVEPDEFERARVGLLSNLVMAGESSGATASRLAADTFALGRPRTLSEISRRVAAINLDGLNEFLADAPAVEPTIVTLGPKPVASSAGPEAAEQANA